MKRISLLCFFLLFSVVLLAQSYRKTNLSAPLKSVVDMSAPGTTFYNPNLLHLDQHPVPYYTDFGNKKEAAQQRRAKALRERNNGFSSYKTTGAAANPVIDTGWLANVGGVPLDNDIAVSNSGMIISAVNTNIYVYDTIGNRLALKGVLNMDTFLNRFTRISDPRLLYDPKEDRFILVCFSGNISTSTSIIMGFSSTNDPLGNWNFYSVDGNPFNDSTWSDYPIISISDKDMFMTFNQIQDNVGWQNGFRQSVIYQIKKSDGFAATPLQYTLWDSIKFNGTLYRNICPAKYQVTNMGDDMYFLSVRNVDVSNDSIFILHIDDSYQSGNATLTQRVVKSPVNYGFPPNPSMNNGNYLMTNDGRVLAAIYENDYIHFGANSVHPTLNNAGVLLGTIQNVSSASPTVDAQVFAEPMVEYGYPSMCYMGTAPNDHRVMFNVAHCYTDSFPGISVVYKNPAGDYSDFLRVSEGNSPLNRLTDSNERWGDYSGIQTVYNNPQQAYLAGTVTLNGNARAWVARIQNADFAVGIQDQSHESRTDVFPNPVEDAKFRTRFTLKKKEELLCNLYDMNGRLIKQLLRGIGKPGLNEFSFDTGVLASGNYMFVILGKNRKVLTEMISVK